MLKFKRTAENPSFLSYEQRSFTNTFANSMNQQQKTNDLHNLFEKSQIGLQKPERQVEVKIPLPLKNDFNGNLKDFG